MSSSPTDFARARAARPESSRFAKIDGERGSPPPSVACVALSAAAAATEELGRVQVKCLGSFPVLCSSVAQQGVPK